MGNIFKSIAKGIGGALSGAASLIPVVGPYASKAVDGLVGSFSSSSDARASLRAQNELLQKQQQFSHDEAELNRQFQREMFDTTNAYNSPKAQVARMVEAGLNPALMYGQGAGSIAAQSPSGSAASAPSAPSPQGLSDLSLRAAEIARINAETNLIKSQTKNTDADTAGKLTFNEFQPQLLTGQIETNNMNLSLGTADLHLKEQEQKKLFKETQMLDDVANLLKGTLDEINAKTANVKADTYSKRVHVFLDTAIAKQQLKEMAARTKKTYEECKAIVANLAIQSRLADSQVSTNLSTQFVNYANAAGIRIQNGRVQFDAAIDKGVPDAAHSNGNFRAWERRMQSLGQVGREANTVLSEWSNFWDHYSW